MELGSTKEEIINFLKFNGLTDPDDIARKLDRTGMCVRQHLYELKENGFIDFSEEKCQGKGRPKKMWHLTDASNQFFPDKHKEMLIDLIDEVKNKYGADELKQLLHSMFERKKDKYQAIFKGSDGLEKKLTRFVQERKQEGFMSTLEKNENGSYTYCESHCSICDTAKVNNMICDVELDFFQELFSDYFDIERQETIADGSVRCTYAFKRKE